MNAWARRTMQNCGLSLREAACPGDGPASSNDGSSSFACFGAERPEVPEVSEARLREPGGAPGGGQVVAVTQGPAEPPHVPLVPVERLERSKLSQLPAGEAGPEVSMSPPVPLWKRSSEISLGVE